MAMHTKGPWMVGVPMEEFNEFNTPILAPPNEHTNITPAVAWARCDIKEVAENAALIAAAPDLLAACKTAKEALVLLDSPASDIGTRAMFDLEIAINKAEARP